jgi:hypothetical protein
MRNGKGKKGISSFFMAKIVIEGKEHTCSEIVKQEIEWQDVRIATAIKLAKMIEDKQDEIDEFTRAKQSEIQDLINQLKAL